MVSTLEVCEEDLTAGGSLILTHPLPHLLLLDSCLHWVTVTSHLQHDQMFSVIFSWSFNFYSINKPSLVMLEGHQNDHSWAFVWRKMELEMEVRDGFQEENLEFLVSWRQVLTPPSLALLSEPFLILVQELEFATYLRHFLSLHLWH